jgi:hypothetical protein
MPLLAGAATSLAPVVLTVSWRVAIARCVAACLTLLLSACGSTGPLAQAPMPLTLAGTVRDTVGGPIAGAEVALTAYADDRCVRLAQSSAPPSDEDRQTLRSCMKLADTTATYEAGRYVFANVTPGSYDVAITWTLRPGQPVPRDPVFEQGDYAVVIVTNRDGTWTVTARSEIVALPGGWTALQDFMFQPPTRETLTPGPSPGARERGASHILS